MAGYRFNCSGSGPKHRFVSPTGKVVLEIGEMCRETGCQRVAITETVVPDGTRRRRGCDFSLSQTHPVLPNAYPLWSADERSVDVVYADAQGGGGKFTLDLEADCTIEG